MAAGMYKWTDEKGIVHYSDQMPPEAVNKGTTVFDKQGRPLKKIEPSPTADQLKAKELEDERVKATARQRDEQQRKDMALLQSYTSEDEIEFARAAPCRRSLPDQGGRGLQRGHDAPSAGTRRSRRRRLGGKPVPAALENELVSLTNELDRQTRLIAQKKDELASINARYDVDKTALAGHPQRPEPPRRRPSLESPTTQPDREGGLEHSDVERRAGAGRRPNSFCEYVASHRWRALRGRPCFGSRRPRWATARQPAIIRAFTSSFAVNLDGSIRLHHEPGGQDRAPQARHPEGHLAVVLSRRQDRRARSQRLGQIDPARIMAGVDREFEGEAVPMPDMRIGYLPQEPQLDPDKTVRETVEEGLGEIFEAKPELDEIYAAYAEPDADFDELAAEQAKYEAIIAADGADSDVQMEIAADALRLPPWDAKIGTLSGGEKRRVALCRLLLSKPDMLLLDEPTNHLDAESVEWLEQFLQRFPGHRDRGDARSLLSGQRGRVDPRARPRLWHSVEGQLQLVARAEGTAPRNRGRSRKTRASRRCTRSSNGCAPIRRGARRRARRASRASRSFPSYEHQKRNETQEIFIPVAERLGNSVIEFKDVSKGYGDRLLIDDLSFSVPPGAIVGVIGPNGAGKTTMFRMITGEEKPDSGEIVIGPTVQLAVVDQTRESLPNDKTAWEAISGRAWTSSPSATSKCRRARTSAASTSRAAISRRTSAQLSGGERGRLHLAATLLKGGNVLLLDEPSNDLDVETLRALEDALLEFAGSALVISHDRWFLDRIATHILAAEGRFASGCSSRATTRTTRPTRASASAKTARVRTACGTSRWLERGGTAVVPERVAWPKT